jgi:hypothetical protein
MDIMRQHQRGEVVTILAISALVILGVTTVASSYFINKKQNTTNTKASETFTCKEVFLGDTSSVCEDFNASNKLKFENYYWDVNCSAACPDEDNNGNVNDDLGKAKCAQLLGKPKDAVWCYGFVGGARCMSFGGAASMCNAPSTGGNTNPPPVEPPPSTGGNTNPPPQEPPPSTGGNTNPPPVNPPPATVTCSTGEFTSCSPCSSGSKQSCVAGSKNGCFTCEEGPPTDWCTSERTGAKYNTFQPNNQCYYCRSKGDKPIKATSNNCEKPPEEFCKNSVGQNKIYTNNVCYKCAQDNVGDIEAIRVNQEDCTIATPEFISHDCSTDGKSVDLDWTEPIGAGGYRGTLNPGTIYIETNTGSGLNLSIQPNTEYSALMKAVPVSTRFQESKVASYKFKCSATTTAPPGGGGNPPPATSQSCTYTDNSQQITLALGEKKCSQDSKRLYSCDRPGTVANSPCPPDQTCDKNTNTCGYGSSGTKGLAEVCLGDTQCTSGLVCRNDKYGSDPSIKKCFKCNQTQCSAFTKAPYSEIALTNTKKMSYSDANCTQEITQPVVDWCREQTMDVKFNVNVLNKGANYCYAAKEKVKVRIGYWNFKGCRPTSLHDCDGFVPLKEIPLTDSQLLTLTNDKKITISETLNTKMSGTFMADVWFTEPDCQSIDYYPSEYVDASAQKQVDLNIQFK